MLNNFSNFDIADHWVPPHYAQTAFGLISSYLISVNLKIQSFVKSKINQITTVYNQ